MEKQKNAARTARERNGSVVEKQLEFIFPKETIDRLSMWYKETTSGRWDYVIYVVRRSYMLALIMEDYTGEKMNAVNETKFLTDASMLNYISEIGHKYIDNGRFPKILLSDDILVHARNTNAVLGKLEEYILKYLKKYILQDFDEKKILEKLAESVEIHVCARAEKGNMLALRYSGRLRRMASISARDWHKMSNDLSVLINSVDMANAAFIFSDSIGKREKDKLVVSPLMKKTEFQGSREIAGISFVLNSREDVVAISTLRLVWVRGIDRWRVLPFLFMPVLSSEEEEKLVKILKKRLIMAGHNFDYDILFGKGEEGESRRTRQEWISFIMSHAILCEYYKNARINSAWKPNDDEIERLSRNYAKPGIDKKNNAILREIMRALLINPPVKNEDDIRDILIETIDDDRKMTVYDRNCYKGVDEERLKVYAENLFYNEAAVDEKEAYDLIRNNILLETFTKRNSIHAIVDVFEALCDELCEDDSKTMIAYFLHMMDTGVLSVSVHGRKNDMPEDGYVQYSKAAEQSLLIYPLRIYKEMALLIEATRYCKSHGLDFCEHMDKFSQSEWFDVDDDLEEMKNFVHVLSVFGETPEDWNAGYYLSTEAYDPENLETSKVNVRDFRNQQGMRVINYHKFIASQQ